MLFILLKGGVDMAFDKEELKRKINMSDFLKKYYPEVDQLTKKDVLYITCPFCDDHNPSCMYNDETSKYPFQFHCHRSQCHFDVIDLVAKLENMDAKLNFKEICELIGQRIGMNVQFATPNPFHEQFKKEKTDLMRIFHNQLLMSVEPLNYLTEERQLTEETIKAFYLGYTLPEEAFKRGLDNTISNRIVFPILENRPIGQAKCLGMAYRVIGTPNNKGIPKYKNDPSQTGEKNQNPNVAGVFVKGNCLFGYAQNYLNIRQANEVYLVEGYLDVISLYQADIKLAVSPMGTALTDEQLNLLEKLTKNVTLFLDSDKAGTKAMRAHLPRLLERGFNVSLIDLKNGKDPADLCVHYEFDTQRIEKILAECKEDALMYCIRLAIQPYHEIAVPLREKALIECESIIRYIKDPYVQEVKRRFIRKELDIL